MVYAICRERYAEKDFKILMDDIDLAVLAEIDPEAAQEVLNNRVI